MAFFVFENAIQTMPSEKWLILTNKSSHPAANVI